MPATPVQSAVEKALSKLGLVRDIDLALHLPMRYEDETRIVRLRGAREGDTVTISPCRPMSRRKSWRLVSVVERGAAV